MNLKTKIILAFTFVVVAALTFRIGIVTGQDDGEKCLQVLVSADIIKATVQKDGSVSADILVAGQKEVTNILIASSTPGIQRVQAGKTFKACYLVD